MSNPIGGSTPPPTTIAPAGGARAAAEQERLRKACVQLEGVFMNELAKALRETVPQDGLLEAGTGGEMFASMLDEKLAELAAARSQSGLSAALLRQLGRRA